MIKTREHINLMILNLLQLKDSAQDYENNQDESLDKIIKNIENCDNYYGKIKNIILDKLVDTREDIIQVEDSKNGIEFK